MVDYIQVVFVGNVGSVREQSFEDGRVLFFDAAVTRKFGGEQETIWLQVAVRGQLLEVVGPRLHVGARVFVVGGLRVSPYCTKDGLPRAGLNIAATHVIVFDRQPAEEQQHIPY